MAEPSHTTTTLPVARSTSLLVVTGLGLIASLVLFPSLGRGAMEPDESLYALATDQIRESGEWWTLSPTPPHPYFNKPPLYMWLSAITYDWLPGFEFKYRFWSAVFGVAAVVMTGLLGAKMFRWEVGVIAGLLLLTNRSLLIDHGARFGGMDAGLTACYAAMLWLYWPGKRVSLRRWAAIGVVAGVASMLKPLGGVPMVLIIWAHAVAGMDRVAWASVLGRPWRTSARAPRGQASTLAHATPSTRALVAVCLPLLVVAAPWYLVNHLRYPDQFASYLFGRQIAGAISGDGDLVGERPWYFYLTAVPGSSRHFLLVIPAVLWLAAVAWRRQNQRSAAALLAIAGVGWVAAISVAEKKFLHYAYPAFVPLAIAIAAMVCDVVTTIAHRLERRSIYKLATCAITVLLVVFAGWLGLRRLPEVSDPSYLWTLYRQNEPRIRNGEMKCLVVDLPTRRREPWSDSRVSRPQVTIYLTHMAEHRGTRDDLRKLMEQSSPAIVVLPTNLAESLQSKPEPLRLWNDRHLAVIEVGRGP